MSAYTLTLENQNQMLRDEVKRYAQAIDSLSEQLAAAQNELNALLPVDGEHPTPVEVASTH